MSFAEVYNVICIIAAGSVFFPITIAFIRIKAFNPVLKALFLYLILSLVSDVISFCLEHSKFKINENIVYNLYSVIEGLFVFNIYLKGYKEKKNRMLVFYATIVFLGFAIWHFLFLEQFFVEDSIVNSIESALVILLSGVYFIATILDENVTKLTDRYFYWINLAFMLYFSASCLIFLNSGFLSRCSERTAVLVYSIHITINILCNVLFSIGIWKMKQAEQ